MEDLLAEIDRKRKALDENNLSDAKFYRRGDILDKEADKRKKDQNVKDELERVRKEKKLEEMEKVLLKEQMIKSGKNVKDCTESFESERVIPRIEVIKRLRSKNLPIILFGESELESAMRLKMAEIDAQDKTKGQTNEFQATLEKIDQNALNDLYKSRDKGLQNEISVFDDVKTLEVLKNNSKNLDKLDKESDCDIILDFIKFVLNLWANELDKRPQDEKASIPGKLESARYEQTFTYIKPLMRRLRKKTLDDDMLKFHNLIVYYCLDGDYVKANDAYLQMAIGNAPWPIGVTMVGIHARTGREKISSQHVAHVLNDETQRKFIQALKRLMSYCQKMYPSTPSKSVEYGAIRDDQFLN